MNKLTIPPCPNWFEANIVTCTADNTLIYGSIGDLVVLNPYNGNEAAKVRIINNAHDRVVAVSANNNWNKDSKLLVSIGEEKVVRLWDLNTFEMKNSHNLHKLDKKPSKLIGVALATDDRIVSVSSDGNIVLWRSSLNETIKFNNIIADKSHVTCMSVCPHATWLAAFGLAKGSVVVADLRKSGKVLYNLRSLDSSAVISLSWCPISLNIFPENKRVILTPKSRIDKQLADAKNKDLSASIKETATLDTREESIEKSVKKESSEDILTGVSNLSLSLRQEQTSVVQSTSSNKALESKNIKENPWVNLKHVDDDELNDSQDVIVDPRAALIADKTADEFDFLSECTALKYRILDERDDEESGEIEELDETKRFEVVEAQEIVATTVDNAAAIKKEFLIASSSKSGSICIWRAGTDGRKQLELQVPNYKRRGGTNRKAQDKTWITIFWVKPNILLSSSGRAELLLWDLLKYKGNGCDHKPSIVHHDHRSLLFTITGRVIWNSLSDTSVSDDNIMTVWTTGQDRQILETNLNAERTCISSYLTLTVAFSMSASPIDSNRIAMGHSDGSITLWNLSMPHLRRIVMNRVYFKNNAKIISLAWHPTKENLLAYATSEAMVAVLNTNNSSAQANNILSSFFKSSVHKVEWGPLAQDSEKYVLYVCGDGKLVYYDVSSGGTAPVSIDLDDEFITHMSWKSDYSALAIATKANSIIMLSLSLEILSSTLVPQKTICKMLWHPTATLNSVSDVSKCCNWLAIGTKAGQCAVYNMVCQPDNQEISCLVQDLKCHSKQITSISWSPYDDGKLITASDDCTAQIWNVETGARLSTYMSDNLDVVTNVLWSPLKENLIICTVKDVVEIWDLNEHNPRTTAEIDVALKSQAKLKNKYNPRLPENSPPQAQAHEAAEKPKKIILLPTLAKDQNNIGQAHSDCRKLLGESESDKNSVMQFFGNKEDVLEMLTNQQHLHIKRNKPELAQHLSLWKGDLSNTIRSAIENGTVTPWLICMTPMVSPQLWQEACQSYATKQSEEADNADPSVTASFFLACHDIENAVNVLAEGKQFREAVVVIKSRLIADSDIYKRLMMGVVDKWAFEAIMTGAYEIAAQCYICLGKYDEAAKALYKRSDVKSLQLAMDIANKGQNDDLKMAIKTRLDMFERIPEANIDGLPKRVVVTEEVEEIVVTNAAEMENIFPDLNALKDLMEYTTIIHGEIKEMRSVLEVLQKEVNLREEGANNSELIDHIEIKEEKVQEEEEV